MYLTTLIVAVNYTDFLRLTLRRACDASDRTIVVTSTTDDATKRLVPKYRAELYQTDRFWANGAAFCKGGAIQEALQYAGEIEWLLLLDADIVLPEGTYGYLHELHLDSAVLYGARRRMCREINAWNSYVRHRIAHALPLERNAGRRQKSDGSYVRCDAPGTQGYFQLWHYHSTTRTIPTPPTAADYDHQLAKQWPEPHRQYIPGSFEVIHLGPNKRNWRGRVTEPWTGALTLPGDGT